jgi:hypothetical protein
MGDGRLSDEDLNIRNCSKLKSSHNHFNIHLIHKTMKSFISYDRTTNTFKFEETRKERKERFERQDALVAKTGWYNPAENLRRKPEITPADLV